MKLSHNAKPGELLAATEKAYKAARLAYEAAADLHALVSAYGVSTDWAMPPPFWITQQLRDSASLTCSIAHTLDMMARSSAAKEKPCTPPQS